MLAAVHSGALSEKLKSNVKAKVWHAHNNYTNMLIYALVKVLYELNNEQWKDDYSNWANYLHTFVCWKVCVFAYKHPM